MEKAKAVYYVNQFYAGIGGEDKAHTGLQVFKGARGPAIGLENLCEGKLQVVKTLACGDNYINDEKNFLNIAPKLKEEIAEADPDVFIAGPAFNAGRYGVACGRMVDFVRSELGIPAVTAMYYENPAVSMYVRENYILETPETAAGMKKVLPNLARFALKLAGGKEIGPARLEGYLPRGYRYNRWHEKTGAERTVELLLKKLRGEEYRTEIPLRNFEHVEPAPPLKDLKGARIALVTTGGLVPKGNPDNLKQAFSETYASYSIKGLSALDSSGYESIHGGFDTTVVNDDPNRLVPLDELRALAEEGAIGSIYEHYLVTAGIGTNVENSKKIGKEMAEELLSAGVHAVILTST